MDLRITARHFDLTQEIQEYAENRVMPLTKYFDRILSSHLILDVEKHRKKAEISTSVYGQLLVSHAVTDDLYASIDEATDKMERQLKKYNAKFNEHRGLTNKDKEEIARKLTEEIREHDEM